MIACLTGGLNSVIVPRSFPPFGYRPGEVLHEVMNSALTTGEVEQEIWTDHSPTQTRSPAPGGVRIGDIKYALLNEVNDTQAGGSDPTGRAI
jgi:hypothetical protein